MDLSHIPFRRTRFAPSPTGYLHLGHVAAAIYVWGMAGKYNLSVLLRLEDHDRSRWRQEYEDAILEDLRWLGFLERTESISKQSERQSIYRTHFSDLESQGLVFGCACSRKDLLSPGDDGELIYPGTCRNKHLSPDQTIAARLNAPGHNDILLRDRQNQWTYQFAVVVDDLDQNIGTVIRGKDIAPSTQKQIYLRKLLKPKSTDLVFYHHKLICDENGQKLSKRFFSEAIAKRRLAGESPQKILGEAAYQVGLLKKFEDLKIEDLKSLSFE